MSTSEAAPAPSRWIQSRWYRRAFVAGFVLLIAIKAAQGIFYKENDFSWHLDLGRSALSGTPYLTPTGDIFGNNYSPGRILIDSVLAMLPNALARALVFACAVGAILIMFRVWRILANAIVRARPGIDFAAATLAFLLLAPWVVRDLDDCGLQLLLLLFLTMAGHALSRGAAIASGAWLALAFTFKSTPLLFLPLLIWKRQYEACAMSAFIVVFNAVAPALVWAPRRRGRRSIATARRSGRLPRCRTSRKTRWSRPTTAIKACRLPSRAICRPSRRVIRCSSIPNSAGASAARRRPAAGSGTLPAASAVRAVSRSAARDGETCRRRDRRDPGAPAGLAHAAAVGAGRAAGRRRLRRVCAGMGGRLCARGVAFADRLALPPDAVSAVRLSRDPRRADVPEPSPRGRALDRRGSGPGAATRPAAAPALARRDVVPRGRRCAPDPHRSGARHEARRDAERGHPRSGA